MDQWYPRVCLDPFLHHPEWCLREEPSVSSVPSVETGLPASIMEQPVVMAARDFSDAVFEKTTSIPADSTVAVLWIRTNEISVATVDLKSVSAPG